MADTVTSVIPPSEWPTVTLGGRSYTVKYGTLSSYELSKAGVSPLAVLTLLSGKVDPHWLAHVIDVWRACTAHEFKLANPPQEVPTSEQWIAMIDSDPSEPLPSIAVALQSAIVKWSAERKAATAPAPPAAPPAQTTETPTPPAE